MNYQRLIVFFLFLASAAAAQEPAREVRPGAKNPEVAGNTSFAIDLYQRLRKQEGNLLISPLSIRTALAMTYHGARGPTADQIERTLSFELRGDALHRAVAEIASGVEGDKAVELRVANSLWGQAGLGFRGEFLEGLRGLYGAGLTEVDFGEAERARAEINAWVASKTAQRIESLLQAGDLVPSTQLVLANAVLFRGRWQAPFAPTDTQDRPFALPAAEGQEARRIQVPTMYQKQELPYYSDDAVMLVELPYGGERFSMVFMLPRRREPLAKLETVLTPAFLGDYLARLRSTEVGVMIPKFRASARFKLNEPLVALGMPDAFDPAKADFSGMCEQRLWIDRVVHQAIVEIDEQGTEAAGAGAVMMSKGGHFFAANRPFLFLIRDRSTGTILFLGRITDPRSGSST